MRQTFYPMDASQWRRLHLVARRLAAHMPLAPAEQADLAEMIDGVVRSVPELQTDDNLPPLAPMPALPC